MDLSYFGLDLQLDRKPLIQFGLPRGIKINSEEEKLNLESKLLISKEESVGHRVQELLNGADSIIGVSNLLIGQITTFSKVIVEVESQKLVLPGLGGQGQREKSLASLTGVDLAVLNAQNVRLGAQTMLHDLPLSVSLGAISVV